MMDSIHGGRPPRDFVMTMLGQGSLCMSCGDFLTLRPEEKDLLDGLDLGPLARVLDFGCGAGRHLRYLRERHPAIECVGIETCDLLQAHCLETIAPPVAVYQAWQEIPHPSFDLILLVGNGLGVMGDEAQARAMLLRLCASLRPAGKLLIETGNPFGIGYTSWDFTLQYNDFQDGPFAWGYADQDWVVQVLEARGKPVAFYPSFAGARNGRQGPFFFAVAG